MTPAAFFMPAEDRIKQYEHYRELFKGMMTEHSPDSGLGIFLARGMMEWMACPASTGTVDETKRPADRTCSKKVTESELVRLLATLIGGV